MQKMYLIFIVFIATSCHNIFGMHPHSSSSFSSKSSNSSHEEQDSSSETALYLSSLEIKTPFFPTSQKSCAEVYVHYDGDMYKTIPSSGKIDDRQMINQVVVGFGEQEENSCILIISNKDNSYGLIDKWSLCLSCTQNLGLSIEQLSTIEKTVSSNCVVIWHDNQRYDVTNANKIALSFQEQFELEQTQKIQYLRDLRDLRERSEIMQMSEIITKYQEYQIACLSIDNEKLTIENTSLAENSKKDLREIRKLTNDLNASKLETELLKTRNKNALTNWQKKYNNLQCLFLFVILGLGTKYLFSHFNYL